MKAYVIAAETVNDPAMFDLYRKQVAVTLVAFGGQFIVRARTWPCSKANGRIHGW